MWKKSHLSIRILDGRYVAFTERSFYKPQDQRTLTNTACIEKTEGKKNTEMERDINTLIMNGQCVRRERAENVYVRLQGGKQVWRGGSIRKRSGYIMCVVYCGVRRTAKGI